MAFKLGMTVDLIGIAHNDMLMLVSMILTMKQGHSGSANETSIISTTKQAISIHGRPFYT